MCKCVQKDAYRFRVILNQTQQIYPPYTESVLSTHLNTRTQSYYTLMSHLLLLSKSSKSQNVHNQTLETLHTHNENILQPPNAWTITICDASGVSTRAADSPKKRKIVSEYICRICLEDCQNIQYCLCTGGMLCHHQCLLEYLRRKVGPRILVEQSDRCEICRYSYKLETENTCWLSWETCRKRINNEPLKFGVYIMFFLLVVSFYIYMGLLLRASVSQDLLTILIVVGVCVSLLFIFFVIVWVYEYFVAKGVILARNKKRQGDAVRKLRKTSVIPFNEGLVEDII